jgi:hypothetical protein
VRRPVLPRGRGTTRRWGRQLSTGRGAVPDRVRRPGANIRAG